MIKERLVSASITSGGSCISSPEVLLGTKHGLWNLNNEVAPRGTLMDINAAWELFLSNQEFSNVSFDVIEHNQHEVIDDVTYEQGDVTYILKDSNGNPTNASFTVRKQTSEGEYDPNIGSLDNLNTDNKEDVVSAINEICNRLNALNIIGNLENLQQLDQLDGIEGNDLPTLIYLTLNNKERLDDINTVSNATIDNLVDNYFNLGG